VRGWVGGVKTWRKQAKAEMGNGKETGVWPTGKTKSHVKIDTVRSKHTHGYSHGVDPGFPRCCCCGHMLQGLMQRTTPNHLPHPSGDDVPEIKREYSDS
jgi:hypothetical protein